MGAVLKTFGLGLIGLVLILVAVLALEQSRAGLAQVRTNVGDTPVVATFDAQAEGPVVLIVHGFAGSSQMMSAWAESLARAGYFTVRLDLEGHGRNPVPMSGDVTSIDGTTQLLLDDMARVLDWAVEQPGAEPRVALIGHSMSSDLVVRLGIADPRVEAIVGLSVFSEAITPDAPQNLLILNGQWEGALRAEAERVMAEIGAAEGESVGRPGAGFARAAEPVAWAEHVSILYAPSGLRMAVDWIDDSFGRRSDTPVARLGWAIVVMLAGAVMLAQPLARLLPQNAPPEALPTRVFWVLALAAPFAAAIVAVRVEVPGLPVLVADFLAAHLGLYGLFTLLGALVAGWRPELRHWPIGFALAAFGLCVFGGLMDRYVASFFPIVERLPIVLAILPGAVLAMWGDAVLTQATFAPLWRRLAVRGAFLASLALAVVLDFERLFFLVLIFPVILLFYGTFGMMGRWAGRRSGTPFAVGIGLGIILAWALGVTFPMYVAGR